MMKKALLLILGAFLFTAPAWAANQDTTVVDLSDVDTDQPVQSPSFENTTPAGQAPGGPIES